MSAETEKRYFTIRHELKDKIKVTSDFEASVDINENGHLEVGMIIKAMTQKVAMFMTQAFKEYGFKVDILLSKPPTLYVSKEHKITRAISEGFNYIEDIIKSDLEDMIDILATSEKIYYGISLIDVNSYTILAEVVEDYIKDSADYLYEPSYVRQNQTNEQPDSSDVADGIE